MSISDEQFNRAFAEFQSFGPARRIPIEERWRKILPDINPSEFGALHAQCKEIESLALKLAEEVRDNALSDEDARKHLAQKYPFLSADRLGHVWSQAVYFSLR